MLEGGVSWQASFWATGWAGVVWRRGGGGFWAGGRLAADCAAVLCRGAAARNSLRFAHGAKPVQTAAPSLMLKCPDGAPPAPRPALLAIGRRLPTPTHHPLERWGWCAEGWIEGDYDPRSLVQLN